MNQAKRLAALFCGLERAYGVAVPTERKDARGKVGARYQTKREPLVEAEWEKHLAGEHCLVPIPIRDDATAGFGAIDIDTYPLDHKKLTARVEELGLPLVNCRSKSGGAHLFLFLAEPYDAETIQDRLMSWAAALGYAGVEVFPKQVSLANENDTGNGIAAPYRNAINSLEYALAPNGDSLDLEGFLDLAESRRVRGETLADIQLPDVDADLDGAPPCLCQWARLGVGEGQRNDVLFDYAVFCKKKWPDSWRDKLEEMNRRYLEPPLPAPEFLAIAKSVSGSKEYTYRSKCQGPYCQPQLCRKQEFGRGGGYDDPGVVLDNLTIVNTDPKTYYLDVNGRRVELTSDCLLNQRKFELRVLEQLDILVQPMKAGAWRKLVNKLLAQKEVEEAPPDATDRGQLVLHLHEFLDQYVDPDRDKLRLEHAWYDELSGRTYFQSKDFITYLKKNRIHGFTTKDVYNALRAEQGGNEQLRVGHQVLRVWWLPRAPVKDEPLTPPDVGDGSEIPF